jgi:protoheme IX farnesyltransferase
MCAARRASEKDPTVLGDLLELTKPGITTMVLITACLGFYLGSEGSYSTRLLLSTLLGTWLVAAGGAALNHFLERDTDAMMRRTANRPLPTGRMQPKLALGFGLALSVAGLVQLWFAVNPLTAGLGTAALIGYVLIYTPLKRVTSLATLVGAVPGAVPPMMGWTGASGQLETGAWVLFGILFLWQLPHFLAIGWLCREDYAQAGFPLLTVKDIDGHRTARHMMVYGAALIPVSILPSVLGLTGATYLVGAIALGLVFLGFCVAFSFSYSVRAARQVLLMSVVYLPAVLAFIFLDRGF